MSLLGFIETFSQCVCVCVFSWKAFVSEYRSLLTRATSESREHTDSCLCGHSLLSFLHFIMQSQLLYHVTLVVSRSPLCPAAILKASVWMSACLLAWECTLYSPRSHSLQQAPWYDIASAFCWRTRSDHHIIWSLIILSVLLVQMRRVHKCAAW